MKKVTVALPERSAKGPTNGFAAALWLVEKKAGFSRLPRGAWLRALSRARAHFGTVEALCKECDEWNRVRQEKRLALLRADRKAEAAKLDVVPYGPFLWAKLKNIGDKRCSDPRNLRSSPRTRLARKPDQPSLFS